MAECGKLARMSTEIEAHATCGDVDANDDSLERVMFAGHGVLAPPRAMFDNQAR